MNSLLEIMHQLAAPPASRYANPPVVMHDTEAEAAAAARLEASQNNGRLYRTGGTSSMEPLIVGQVYVVATPKPYDQLKEGDIMNYKPKWANGGVVIHRGVQKDKDGWIASGDNNPRSESWERIRPDNYLDTVTTIHTYKGAEKTRTPRK